MAEAVLRFRNRGVLHVGFGDIFLEDLRAYRETETSTSGHDRAFSPFGRWIRANLPPDS